MPAHIAGVLHAVPAPVWLPEPGDVNALMPELWASGVAKRDGVLSVRGLSAPEIAERFGTPVQVLDAVDLRERAARHARAFSEAFAAIGTTGQAYYAGKAFLCTAVARWVAEAGLGVDACTLGEMRIAQAAGVDPSLVGLHGNSKSDAEIAFALDWGIGRIIVDSLDEIDRVEAAAAFRGVRAPVMIRATPGVEAHTHDFIATAHEDQKFGLSIHTGDARAALDRALDAEHLDVLGIHSHIGSQIFDVDGFDTAARRIIRLRADVLRDRGVLLPEVDLGGGFGIKYTSQDDPLEIEDMAGRLAAAVRSACEAEDTPLPAVSVEPGRSVIGPAMLTLYRVGTVKRVATGSGSRTFVSVDGGMSDNIRTALYDADYSCTLASRPSEAAPIVSRVVGKHCESGDIVVRDEYLPDDIAAGDLIAVPGTGAYCRPLASNYNAVPRPGVLAVDSGEATWIVRPETYEDMFALDPGFDRA